MSRTSKALLRLGVPGLAAVTLVAGIPAFLGTAQAAPINSLTIAPVDGNDSGAAGSCQAYVVTGAASATNTSTVGETVNVVLTDNTGSASSDVSFCTAPTTVGTTTFTPAAGTPVTAGGPQTGGGSVDQSRFTLGAGTTAVPNNGRVIIGLTRNNPTTPANSVNGLSGNVNIQAYSDQNGNNAFNAGEPQANRTTAFTAGGPAGSNANQDAVAQVEVIDGGETATATADADTDTALAGEQRTFTVGANNGTDPVAGATVSFSINSSVDTGDRGTAVFGVTNNDGTVTGNITFPTAATDVVTFFVNQSGASSTPNLDAAEPRDTVTVTVQANTAQQNRAVALTALADAGAGLNRQTGSSAVNVTTDQTREFRATVTDTRSSGASASTAGVLLSFAVSGGSGDETVAVINGNGTPGGFTNECTTVDEPGTATPTNDSFCDVRVTDPTPTNGQTLTITATVRGTTATGTGTLRFRAAPNTVRNIAVTPDSGETLTQNVRQFTATASDVNGRGVEGVVVDFTESGPGFIRGASSVTTGVDGTAVIETTTAAGETGTETVTGTVNASQTDENGAASTPQTGRAAGSPAGSTAGNASDTGTTTWVTTLSPSPSASPASPSPSATSTVSPSPSSTGQATRLGISVSPATITPGIASVVTVTGTPGTIIELQAYSRPNTTYGVVRRGTILENGTIVFRVTPGTNTRLFAAVTGQTGNESPSVVINVKTALSLTVVRNGSRDYTFQGRILPRRAGQLITLYRVLNDGREIITSQIRTDNSGTYRIRRVFTGSGVFGFLTRTGQTLTNAAGESNNGEPRPTAIYSGPQR